MNKNSSNESGSYNCDYKKEGLLDKFDYNYRCELTLDSTFSIQTLPVQVRLQTESKSLLYKLNVGKEDSDKYLFYKELLLKTRKPAEFDGEQLITKFFGQKGRTFSWVMHYTNPNRAQMFNAGCLKVLARLAVSGSNEITDEDKQIEGAGILCEDIERGTTGIITIDQAKIICSFMTQNFECINLIGTECIGGYEIKQRNISQENVRLCLRGRRHYSMRIVAKNAKKYDLNELKRLLLICNILALDFVDVMETETHIYTVTELIEGGSLATHLPAGGFDDVTAKFYIHQITQSLYFYHCNNVFHKNLRLSNMILKSDGYNVKISGFGLSRPCYTDISTLSPSELAYVPPEFLKSDADFSKIDYKAANVWSLGIILHEMITGTVPFAGDNARETATLIETADYKPGESGSEGLDLVRCILQKDPQARPTLTAIMKHPWMHVIKADIRSPLMLKFTANCVYVQPQGTLCLLRNVLCESGIIYKDIVPSTNYDYSALCFSAKAGIKFCVSFYREVNSAELGVPAGPETGDRNASYVATSPPASVVSMSKISSIIKADSNDSDRSEDGNATGSGINSNSNGSTGSDNNGSNSSSSSSKSGSEVISKDMNLFFKIEFKSGDGSRFPETGRKIKEDILLKLQNSALVKTDVPIDRNVLLMTAAHLAEEFRVSFEQELHENKATVLLLGKTGSGKSSVANRIFGTKIAEVGQGKPVTKHFTCHTMLGKPVVVYDSKGFEVNSANQFKAEMDEYFAKCNDKVHVIWYVIDGTSSRFEPFEHEFLSSSPLGVPVIVLVNKADLCAPADIAALSAAVSSASIPCVKGVIATVTASETVEQPPERCPECGSDDISVLRKKLQWRCNGCDGLHPLKVTSSLHHGLVDVVNLTHSLVPDLVKEAFVASQSVSIKFKLEASLEVIKSLPLPQISKSVAPSLQRSPHKYNSNSANNDDDSNGNGGDVPLGNFIKVLVKICTIWDVSLGNEENSIADNDKNSNTFARQLLCDLLPLFKKNDKSDLKRGDECCEKPAEIALQPSVVQQSQSQQQQQPSGLMPPQPLDTNTHDGDDGNDIDEFGNSARSDSDSDDNLIECASDDEIKKAKLSDKLKQQVLLQWRWKFIEHIIDVLGNSIKTVEDKGASSQGSGTPPSAGAAQATTSTSLSPSPAVTPTTAVAGSLLSSSSSSATGSSHSRSVLFSPRRRSGLRTSPRDICVVPPAPPPLPNTPGKIQTVQAGEWRRRRSLDGKPTVITSIPCDKAAKMPLPTNDGIDDRKNGSCSTRDCKSTAVVLKYEYDSNGEESDEDEYDDDCMYECCGDDNIGNDKCADRADGDVGDGSVLRGFEERRFFLIHAIAIVWTQSLLSFYLLLLDYGYDTNNPACRKGGNKEFEHMLKGCVERAFAYFNVEVISQVEAFFEKDRESGGDESEDGLVGHALSSGALQEKMTGDVKVRSLDEAISRVFYRSVYDVLKSLENSSSLCTSLIHTYNNDIRNYQKMQTSKLQRLQPLPTNK